MHRMHRRRRGTATVENSAGILLVSARGRTYFLPGGGAKRGESREEAAIRELREETGLKAADCTYLFEYTSLSSHHKVFLIKSEGIPKPNNEIKYIAYFNRGRSRVNVSSTTRKIIDRYYGIGNSEDE